MDRFRPLVRPQIAEYFARMSAKKAVDLSRRKMWRRNVEALLARWPDTHPLNKLAALAGVRYETISKSRMIERCPLTDDPSPALQRLCAVLGVNPSSLFASHLEIVADVTTEFSESAKRIDALNIKSSKRTARSTSDIETMFRFSSLKPGDKAVVRELINRLSQLTSVSPKLPEQDQKPDAQSS